MARKVLTSDAVCGNILSLSARLAQLVEHMLDVHGVTGSSPVPRTMIKSPETTMVSGLFVILTKDAAGIIWKTLRKVAKTAFSVFSPHKKQAVSLNGETACFCVLMTVLFVRPAHEIVQCHHVRLTAYQLIMRAIHASLPVHPCTPQKDTDSHRRPQNPHVFQQRSNRFPPRSPAPLPE